MNTDMERKAREIYQRGGVEVLAETVELSSGSPADVLEGGWAAVVGGDYRVEGTRLTYDARRRYAQKMWIEDFLENAVYLPHKQAAKAGAPTSAGRIHRYAKTTSRRAGP